MVNGMYDFSIQLIESHITNCDCTLKVTPPNMEQVNDLIITTFRHIEDVKAFDLQTVRRIIRGVPARRTQWL